MTTIKEDGPKKGGRHGQMMQLFENTQFYAADMQENHRAKVEEFITWTRKTVQSFEGCFWVARIIKRACVHLSEDEPGKDKWARASAQLTAEGNDMARCTSDFNKLFKYGAENVAGGVSQFRAVWDSMRARADGIGHPNPNPRVARALESLVYTDPAGKDKVFEDVYTELNAVGDSMESIELLPQGTTLVDLGDGTKWVNIGKHGDQHEKALMHHCGNLGGRSQDRLLSYRVPSNKIPGYFEPKLTFIFNPASGEIGEMKGFANKKPAPEFHRPILALLKLPMIKGLSGEGYLPENNFNLNDLSVELLAELAQARPDLIEKQANKSGGYQALSKESLARLKEFQESGHVDKPKASKHVEPAEGEDNPLPE